MADGSLRLQMCQEAFKDNEKMVISDIEINLAATSYTIDTLEKLRALYGEENEKGENSKFICEILDMLRSPFVRSDNTESVRPYLFKYLLEFARIENPGVNLYF